MSGLLRGLVRERACRGGAEGEARSAVLYWGSLTVSRAEAAGTRGRGVPGDGAWHWDVRAPDTVSTPPTGGARALSFGASHPAPSPWVELGSTQCGVWFVVCGVRQWCVGGVVAGVWCDWSLATPGGGSCVLLPATPCWVSLPVVVGVPRHSWLRVPGAVSRHSWLGFAVEGGGCSSPLLAEGPRCGSPPLLAGVRWRRWCVVCGVWCVMCGVRRWCVGGVVAGVWCGWSLATPGGGFCVLLPATPDWVSLPVVVGGPRHSCPRVRGAVPRHSGLGSAGGGGVWCVVCGVRRWCVGEVVAGVWSGWSLATPGEGPCVLLPATPGWVSLPVVVGVPRLSWLKVRPGCGSPPLLAWVSLSAVVGAPRHSWLRVPGAVPRHSRLGSAGSSGVWCVVCGVWCVGCGGGVLVGLWLVCGVVGPSPLLAEVPVCYSPPLLAVFCCRWEWAVLATPG